MLAVFDHKINIQRQPKFTKIHDRRRAEISMARTMDAEQDDNLARKSNVTGAIPPSTEYFGFALHVGASLVLAVYMAWAFLPKSWLEAVNVYYYPSRWWALALPAFVLVLMMYIYVALAAYNTEYLTKQPTSLETLTDTDAKIETDMDFMYQRKDAVRDLPLASVCQVLYS